jgi:hypothetical protein
MSKLSTPNDDLLPEEFGQGSSEAMNPTTNVIGDLRSPETFGVRALYLFAKFVFPKLNEHDRVIIDRLLSLLSTTSQQLDDIFEENKDLISEVHRILSPHTDLPPTLTNYAGIVLGKMEDTFYYKIE